MNKSEQQKLAVVQQLFETGQRSQALLIADTVYRTASSDLAKLHSISVLTATLDQAEQNDRLIALCDEGVPIARRLGDQDSVTSLQIFKANCLTFTISGFIHRRSSLKLVVPGLRWLGFALETEKLEYDELNIKIADYEKQSSDLLATVDLYNSSEPTNRAYFHNLMARVIGGQLSNFRLANLRWGRLAQTLYSHSLIKHLLSPLKRFVIYRYADRMEMERMLSKVRAHCLESVQIYRELGDADGEASALLNLAMELCTYERYSEAHNHLIRLRELGKASLDKSIPQKIEWVENRIRTRNKCVPNYVNGEAVPSF